ncbi:thiolase C-terminal domain-containing protein [Halorientalis marina]|jgi:acetyl-CoA acetyltransferase|uniref:thiolase C-terminal domain-containing protein n=1 Tax=Halorientalis marina TaxID=2931976 RepID=UPI001FF47058|nr:3-ketoacyl-CoA thiolase [Halorientalis marina]
MQPAHVLSVGASDLGDTDLPGRDLFSAALAEAFADLPDPASVVDALYVGNQSERYENQIMYGTLAAEWAGLRNVPAERVEACAAAGALALKNAVRDVRAGVHDAVLACGIEKMTAGGTEGATNALSAAFERALEQRSGITAPSLYAMLARRYCHEFDADETDLARIAVKNHRNAAANPRAMFQREVDVDTVLDSDYVAPPLKLFDCAPVTDGAAAVLVANDEVADELGIDDRVTATGSSVTVNNLAVAERDLTYVEGADVAVTNAYDEAGIDPSDVDIAEVHDAFTICEALLAEAAGFAPQGHGVETVRDPSERSDGWTDVQINTSGGLKARGHPIGATGLLQAVEAHEQLTGRAGDRQVDGAETALLINEGGLADAATAAHVLTTQS